VIGTLSLAPWLAPASPVPGLIHHRPSAALAAASTHTDRPDPCPARPAATHRRLASGFVVALTACSIVAAGVAAQGTHDRFEAAQATYHHHG